MPSARHISLLHPSPTTETHPVTLPSHQPPSQATAKPPGEKKEQRRRRRRRHKTHANISALVQPRIPGLPVKPDNETRPRLGQGGQQHQRFKTGPEKGVGRRVQNKNTHSLCNTSVALAASWRLHVSSLSFSWAVFGQSAAGGRCWLAVAKLEESVCLSGSFRAATLRTLITWSVQILKR